MMRTVRHIHGGIAVATAMVIVYGSWVPFRFENIGLDVVTERLRSTIGEPWRWQEGRADWAINSLITLPLGFCVTGALLAGRRTAIRSIIASALALAGAFCLSVTVEFGQIWLDGRVASLKDVAAQTTGTVGGIIAYLGLGSRLDGWLAEFVSDRGPDDRTQWILRAYVVGFFGYSMLPLDVVMSMAELAQKFDNGRIEIIPFSHPYASALDAIYGYGMQAILSVPVGMLGVVAYRNRGAGPRPFLDSLLWSTGILVTIETAQFFIVSRFTSTTDVIMGIAGSIIGVAFMRRIRGHHPIAHKEAVAVSSGAAKWFAILAAYASLIAIVFWYPYDFTDDKDLIKQRLSDFWTLPFSRLFEGSYLHSLSSILRMAAWFLPFGGVAARCVDRLSNHLEARRLGLVIAAIGIIGWAFVIELGQVLLPSRFADSTDVIVCGAGGVLGLFVASRLLATIPAVAQVSVCETLSPPSNR